MSAIKSLPLTLVIHLLASNLERVVRRLVLLPLADEMHGWLVRHLVYNV